MVVNLSNIKKITSIVYSLVLSILYSSAFAQNECPEVKNGIMDLSSYAIEQKGSVYLDGKWEFYYNRLLRPGEFEDQSFDYVQVPGTWSEIIHNEKELGSYGYATYRLKLRLPEHNKIYTVRMPRVDVCYKIWVNGQSLLEIGKVGTNQESEEPRWFINEVSFLSQQGENEIIIQISNFHHRKNGFNGSIELGTPEQIVDSTLKDTAYTFFSVGLMLIMALYHFGLFSLRPKDYSKLFFGLTAFFVAMHQLANSQVNIMNFLPSLPFEAVLKTNYIANNLRVVSFVLFIYFSFKEEVNKYFVKVMAWYGIAMTLLILISNTKIYTHTLILFETIGVISITYILFALIKSTIHKRDGALYSLIGTLVLLAAASNDILHDAMIIRSFYAVPLGLFVFIFLQSHMLAVSSVRSFKRNEELSDKLNYVNKNLEELVQIRTTKIEEQKEELRVINEKLESQKEQILNKNNELYQQNEEILSQRDELHHRGKMLIEQKERLEKSQRLITDSILYAKQIQSAILPRESNFNKYFEEHFIIFKPRDIVSGDFYYINKRDNFLIFAAVDCTGHGVPGGFMSMLGIAFLNEITQNKEVLSTGTVLDKLDLYVQKALKQTYGDEKGIRDGMDIALCCLNLETNHLQYSGAYNPFVLIRNNKNKPDELVEIDGDAMPIGIHHSKKKGFTTHNIQVNENDVIYLFSDGFSDQFGGEKGRKYMLRNFKNKLYDIHELPMKEQKKLLELEFANWKDFKNKKERQIDDVLVMGLKIAAIKQQ